MTEPYYTTRDWEEICGDTVEFWVVRDEHHDTVAKFYTELYRPGRAEQAAEDECARRNNEWREEMGE